MAPVDSVPSAAPLMNLDDLFKLALSKRASDILLSPGAPATLRVEGVLESATSAVLASVASIAITSIPEAVASRVMTSLESTVASRVALSSEHRALSAPASKASVANADLRSTKRIETDGRGFEASEAAGEGGCSLALLAARGARTV